MTDNQSQTVPSSGRGLVCENLGQPLSVQTKPTPEPVHGSVVVHVLATHVVNTSKDMFEGKLPYLSFPTPFVPGANGVGRVVAAGPDATSLKVGQLVLVDSFIRGRDDPNVQILLGLTQGMTEASQKLFREVWRDAMWQEYVSVPLENCHALNEKALLGSPAEGGLGYDVADLSYIPRQLVSYGGLRAMDLEAGETVIVAPATGGFSGCAVEVASAMGARVIAAGRNLDKLRKIAASIPRVEIVQLTGDVDKDAAALRQFGDVDGYLDFSPGTVTNPTHMKSSLAALKPYGRVTLMGGFMDNAPISYFMTMFNSITIRGQFMYKREDVRGIINLAEKGLLKLGRSAGVENVGEFGLEEWDKAFEVAAKNSEWGKHVVFKP